MINYVPGGVQIGGAGGVSYDNRDGGPQVNYAPNYNDYIPTAMAFNNQTFEHGDEQLPAYDPGTFDDQPLQRSNPMMYDDNDDRRSADGKPNGSLGGRPGSQINMYGGTTTFQPPPPVRADGYGGSMPVLGGRAGSPAGSRSDGLVLSPAQFSSQGNNLGGGGGYNDGGVENGGFGGLGMGDRRSGFALAPQYDDPYAPQELNERQFEGDRFNDGFDTYSAEVEAGYNERPVQGAYPSPRWAAPYGGDNNVTSDV